MSRPIASGCPAAPGEQPGADRPAGGSREDAPGTGPGRLRGVGGAAGGAHHLRLGEAHLAAGRGEAGRDSGRAGGRGRRRSRWSRSARTRGRPGSTSWEAETWMSGSASRSAAREAPLVAPGRERRRAGRRRRTRRPAPALAPRARPTSSSRERLDHAVRPDPLAQPRTSARERPAARGFGSARVVEARPVLPADLEEVGEPSRRDQRGAGAALLKQRVRPHGHAVGEGLDAGRLGARPSQHLLDRGDHAAGLVLGRARNLGRVEDVRRRAARRR